MGNEALSVNDVVGPQADLAITTRASDWYYAVCALMSVSSLAVMVLAYRKPHNQRLFHQITGFLLAVAAIAYFSMGSNLGQTPIQAEFVRHGSSQVRAAGTREIFWARYIDWVITTPLLLTDLCLTAALPWSTIIGVILADEIMIVCGLIGALTQTSYKWGYWTFGMVALFYVTWVLLMDGRQSVNVLGGAAKKTYYACGMLTIGLWFLYPIAWGVSEGGNLIHPDSEAIFYGVLDVLAKPVFSFMLLWGHRNIEFSTLGLNIPEFGHPYIRGDHAEKHGLHNGHNSHNGHNGVNGSQHNGHTAMGDAAAISTGPNQVPATHTQAQV